MQDPSPLEYVAAHGIIFVVLTILVGFAVVGIFATVEEVAFRVRRYRYRKAHDLRGRAKTVKKPR
jgi:hypothetical protein